MSTVFLLDDDESLRELLTRFLEREHHRVFAFRSPMEALPMLRERRPDVIVSDVQMPGMSGLEFATELQRDGITTPVILITGNLTDEVQQRADALGVRHVFQKPIRDLSRLSAAVDGCSNGASPQAGHGLDQLRLEFLTGLSHEIRTPLTAIKIALDGVFAAQASELSPEHRKLVGIGQRNVDRIVSVVERQLDLLQITLGAVAVSRRLTNLDDVLERALRTAAPQGTDGPARASGSDRPVLFTDPDRLQVVFEFLVERACRAENGPEAHKWLDGDNDCFAVTFRGVALALQSRNRDDFVVEPAEGEFGYRACERLVTELGGSLQRDGDPGSESVTVRVPFAPPFDRRGDFITPVKNLRRTAKLNESTVTLFKCELTRTVCNTAFLQRCLSTLGDGDMLARGCNDGTFYLGLLGRNRDECEQLVRFLANTEGRGRVDVVLVQTMLPGESYPDDLMLDLEAVT